MNLFYSLNTKIPPRIRSILKKLGFQAILNRLITKSQGELIFQSIWVSKFKDKKSKVKEYWNSFLFFDDIKKICKFTSQTMVLDVGCGISTVLHFVKGKRYGIDPLANEYSKIYHYPEGVVIQKGVGESIPFDNNLFEVVFCTNVLDHTDIPDKVVREIYRVLKTGGYLILVVHCFNNRTKRDPAHPHTFVFNDVDLLTKKYFRKIFNKLNPDVNLYDYLESNNDFQINKDTGVMQLIQVLKKK